MRSIATPRLDDDQRLSLGLSAGLDSRTLLALCIDNEAFTTHTFGDPQHPDVAIPRRIARNELITHHHLHDALPDPDTCLDLLRTHVAQTHTISPASSALKLRYYPTLHAQNKRIIDGGFGEIARRQYMNRLLVRGPRTLRSATPDDILPYLRFHRADVFTADAVEAMLRGTRRHLDVLWRTLPDASSMTDADLADLISIRTRLPNFFGFEQSRLDELAVSYMPFAQPSVLRAVFALPHKQRRNGTLFRRIIREQAPSLTQYPLVKGDATYPFFLPTLPAYLWTKAKRLLGWTYIDAARHAFLHNLHEWIRDTVHSQSVRNYAAYDHSKLTRLVERYYGGDSDLASDLDWWLAFEVWRRQIANASC